MTNKTKFIIMTTAIIRPILHDKSIKFFYDKHYLPNKNKIDEEYDITHIINIDQPEKLKNHFTLESTLANFNKIIPEDITKIYITPENPSFLQAYKNIMCKINELNLLSENNLYWWFEDDWVTNGNTDFFEEIKILKYVKNSAITLTKDSPIGSFRAGPVMSGDYFITYFNIVNIGCMCSSKLDPEIQVRRHIGALNDINSHKKINLVMLYFDFNILLNDVANGKMLDYNIYYYKKKFNSNTKYGYCIMIMNGNEVNCIEYNEKINFRKKENYESLKVSDLEKIFSSSSIVYFIRKPFVFEDIGRNFMKEYNAT
jgi:hypothetical protein